MLNLTAACIAAIVGAPGGGPTDFFITERKNDQNTAWLYRARGDFNLTSLTLRAATSTTATSVPEPGTMALLGFAALGAAAARRRRV